MIFFTDDVPAHCFKEHYYLCLVVRIFIFDISMFVVTSCCRRSCLDMVIFSSGQLVMCVGICVLRSKVCKRFLSLLWTASTNEFGKVCHVRVRHLCIFDICCTLAYLRLPCVISIHFPIYHHHIISSQLSIFYELAFSGCLKITHIIEFTNTFYVPTILHQDMCTDRQSKDVK